MANPEPIAFCEYLNWDSEFFGHRIARITVSRLTKEILESVEEWCQSNNIDCLYFLGDADDSCTARLAEDQGFRLVDIRVTLDRELDESQRPNEASASIVRMWRPEDIPTLRAMAAVNHYNTRFYYDPHFSVPQCEALYATWIERSCQGYADAVLVAELNGSVAGYISCLARNETTGQIGLFGIEANCRGQGVGERLINESLRWFEERGVNRVSVVTQGRNVAGQRVYQRCGFMTRKIELYYHYWCRTS